MATAGQWTLTNAARRKISDGTFTSASSYKVGLALGTSNLGLTSTAYASLTNEVANNPSTTGYTTGGIAVTINLVDVPITVTINGVNVSTTGDEWRFTTNPAWTSVSANLVGRTAFLYKVGGDIFAYSLLDVTNVDLTTTVGNVLTIDSDGTPGPVITLA